MSEREIERILAEQEPIVGAPILSVTQYCDLFDVFDRRK